MVRQKGVAHFQPDPRAPVLGQIAAIECEPPAPPVRRGSLHQPRLGGERKAELHVFQRLRADAERLHPEVQLEVECPEAAGFERPAPPDRDIRGGRRQIDTARRQRGPHRRPPAVQREGAGPLHPNPAETKLDIREIGAVAPGRYRRRRHCGTVIVRRLQTRRQRAFEPDAPRETLPFGELARETQRPAAGLGPDVYRQQVRQALAAAFEFDGAQTPRDNGKRQAVKAGAAVEVSRPAGDPERNGFVAEPAARLARDAARVLDSQPGQNDVSLLPQFGGQLHPGCGNAEQPRPRKVQMQPALIRAETLQSRPVGVERQVFGLQPGFELSLPPPETAFDPGAVETPANLLDRKIGAFEPRPQRLRRNAPSGKPQPSVGLQAAQARLFHRAGVDPEPLQQGAQVSGLQREGGALMPLSRQFHPRSAGQRCGQAFHPEPVRVAPKRRFDLSRRPVAEPDGAGIERKPQARARRPTGELRQQVAPPVELQHTRGEARVDLGPSAPVRPNRAGEPLVRYNGIDPRETRPVGAEQELRIQLAVPRRPGGSSQGEPPGEDKAGRRVLLDRAGGDRLDAAVADRNGNGCAVPPFPDRARDIDRPAVQRRFRFQPVRAFRPPDRQCRGFDRHDRIPESDAAVLETDVLRGKRRQRPHEGAVEGQLDPGELQPVDLEAAGQQGPGIQNRPRLPHADVDGGDAGNRQNGPWQQVQPDGAVQGNLPAQRFLEAGLQMGPVESARTLPRDGRKAGSGQHNGDRDDGKSAHRAPAVLGSGPAKTGTYTKRADRWRRSSI